MSHFSSFPQSLHIFDPLRELWMWEASSKTTSAENTRSSFLFFFLGNWSGWNTFNHCNSILWTDIYWPVDKTQSNTEINQNLHANHSSPEHRKWGFMHNALEHMNKIFRIKTWMGKKKRDQDHDHGQLCYIHHTSCFVYLRWPTKICNTIPRILPWFHILCGISLSKHMLWFLCNSFSMLSENMNSGFYCWWKNSVILWMNTIVRYTSSNRIP